MCNDMIWCMTSYDKTYYGMAHDAVCRYECVRMRSRLTCHDMTRARLETVCMDWYLAYGMMDMT